MVNQRFAKASECCFENNRNTRGIHNKPEQILLNTFVWRPMEEIVKETKPRESEEMRHLGFVGVSARSNDYWDFNELKTQYFNGISNSYQTNEVIKSY